MPDIAILVTSLHQAEADGLDFVFTDRHAFVRAARFSRDLQELDRIDWPLLQRRDFSRDLDDPAKGERYQAEALIHKVVPVSTILRIVCYGPTQQSLLVAEVARHSLPTKVIASPDWYF